MADIGPILIVNLAKRYGGAVVRVIEIANALHGRIPYAVATLTDSPLHKRLVEEHLIALPLSFNKGDPRLLLALFRTIRKNGYQIVDAHNTQSQLWAHLSAWLAKVPVKISTVHSSYRDTYKGMKGWLHELVLKMNARLGCKFIAVSESVSEYLQRIGIQRNIISLIHNGIKLEEDNQTHNLTIRESIGWSKDTYVVIAVGRLEPEKGHKYLIDAISHVVKDRPKVRCLIVGEGREKEKLDSQIKKLKLDKIVCLAGFRSDIRSLLKVSNLFCMPSLSEGLPFALLEACACRLPLLVTKVGGMARLLTNDKNAVLVPPQNSESLAKGLIYLMDNPETSTVLGNAAYALVRDTLSNEQMITKTLAVYNKNITIIN